MAENYNYSNIFRANTLLITQSENIDCVVAVCFPSDSPYVGQHIKNRRGKKEYCFYSWDYALCKSGGIYPAPYFGRTNRDNVVELKKYCRQILSILPAHIIVFYIYFANVCYLQARFNQQEVYTRDIFQRDK